MRNTLTHILVGLLFFGSVFAEDKAAEKPASTSVNAIKKAINNLLDGVDHHSISLRKGDEYHDLAHRFNVLFADYHLIKKDEIEDDEI